MRAALLALALVATGCGPCTGSAPSDPAGQEPAAPQASPSNPDVAATQKVAEPSVKLAQPLRTGEHPPGTTGADLIAKAERKAHPSLRAMRVAARKLLAADKSVAANTLGYKQAVERTQREMKELNLARRMPAEPLKSEDIRPAIETIALQHKVTLIEVLLGTPSASRALPKENPDRGPYAYHPDQIVAQQPLTITIDASDDGKAATFYRHLKKLPGPLLDINVVRATSGGTRLAFSGVIPNLRAVQPPVQVVRTPTLSELARDAGVEIPEGDYPTDDIHKLLDEHRALHSDLSKAMKQLAMTHLLGLQLRFAKQRIEALNTRPFPQPIGRKGPELQRSP